MVLPNGVPLSPFTQAPRRRWATPRSVCTDQPSGRYLLRRSRVVIELYPPVSIVKPPRGSNVMMSVSCRRMRVHPSVPTYLNVLCASLSTFSTPGRRASTDRLDLRGGLPYHDDIVYLHYRLSDLLLPSPSLRVWKPPPNPPPSDKPQPAPVPLPQSIPSPAILPHPRPLPLKSLGHD